MADKKKIGRPPKGSHANSVKLTVRISEPLNEKINRYSEKHNLTKAETVRKALNDLPE
ncbi:CopG family transcriptional regulator [Aerococcus sp. UMB1112A]|uniref:CopG family transcriptional regulator n=1 Tax=Aerococcus sp. UMB1112A TaxID=3050609 RepID=UPI00254D2D4E|nr:CopG family transcriptional regulator [Aerococcus sp. UMB1112A]MDK8502120.1 CopG family transcriptional regulator [Aerococcus sp. UMB1112A]